MGLVVIMDVRNSVNSAILSGAFGLQKASQGITASSFNIAQRSTEPLATQQIGSVSQLLPSGGDSLTSNLVGLSINARNAEASAKVLDVASGTVGRIIDELA
jgi:hypothetical protein